MPAAIPTLDEVRQVVREELERALARPGDDLLTTDQAADAAGVQPKTVRAWIAEGLPAARRGRRLLVSRAALRAWTAGGSPPAAELVSTLTRRAG